MKFEVPSADALYLRAMVSGPSGAGKTTSSLRIAGGIARKLGKSSKEELEKAIGVIDTENGRSGLEYGRDYGGGPLYFSQLKVPNHKPDTFLQALRVAYREAFDVLLVDSLTHEWEGIRALVDDISAKDKRKQGLPAWGVATPKHDEIMGALQKMPSHVIGCFRSKTMHAAQQQEVNGKTKTVIERLGMQPMARDGTEFEFDLHLELSPEGYVSHGKRPRGIFTPLAERTWESATETLGVDLIACLTGGEASAVVEVGSPEGESTNPKPEPSAAKQDNPAQNETQGPADSGAPEQPQGITASHLLADAREHDVPGKKLKEWVESFTDDRYPGNGMRLGEWLRQVPPDAIQKAHAKMLETIR